MNLKEAQEKWKVTSWTAKKMAEFAKFPKEHGQYVIPDEFVTAIYVPDKRKYGKSALKPYLQIMDSICQNRLFLPDKMGIEIDRIHTYVKELKEADLIRLIEGRNEESLDCNDYVQTLRCGDWFHKKSNEKIEYITKIAGELAECGTKGVIGGILEYNHVKS